MVVGHFDGPNASAGANVEDTLRTRYGGQVQSTVKEEFEDMVFKVHAVEFILDVSSAS